jgi:hypothetical protein
MNMALCVLITNRKEAERKIVDDTWDPLAKHIIPPPKQTRNMNGLDPTQSNMK